jgi:hypothetical protein
MDYPDYTPRPTLAEAREIDRLAAEKAAYEAEFLAWSKDQIGLYNLGLVMDIATIMKMTTFKTSAIYVAGGEGKIDLRKIRGKTVATTTSVLRMVYEARSAGLTTGLRGRSDLTDEQTARLAAAATPAKRGRGRPIGSQNKPLGKKVMARLENRAAT